MAKMTYVELNATLDENINVGVIYNVDYNNMKSFVANRLLNEDINSIRDRFTRNMKWKSLSGDEYALVQTLDDVITRFPSKKTIKAMGAVTDGNVWAGVKALIVKWEPIAQKFRTIKPMIHKGRKPSNSPSDTDKRTIDNTGTCAVCGGNVKLRNGTIVDHGYNLKWGMRSNNCIGVDFDPIEISNKGLFHFGKVLADNIHMAHYAISVKSALLSTLNKKDDDCYNTTTAAIRGLTMDIKWMSADLEVTYDRLASWEAQPLPDTQYNNGDI